MMVCKKSFAVAVLSLSLAVAPSAQAISFSAGFATVKNKAAGLANTIGSKAMEIGLYAYTNGWKTGAVLGGVAAVTGLAVYAVKKLTKPQQQERVYYSHEYTKCAQVA